MNKKFLGLDSSTWVTIVIQLITIVFFFGVYSNIIGTHTKQLETIDTRVTKIEEVTANSIAQIKLHGQIIDSLVIRANKIDTALTGIEVIRNDMDWLKRSILKEKPATP